MRRASSKLLSHIHSHIRTSSSLFCRDFVSDFCTSITATDAATAGAFSDRSYANPTEGNLSSCSKTQSLHFSSHKTHQNVGPTVESKVQMSSRQRKIREKSKFEEAFESAESTDEMLKAFKDMESCFEEKELGLACLKIGLKLDREGEDPDKALYFAQRALKILDDSDNGKMNLPLAMALQLLGSVCFSQNRFNESLGYLNRSNRVLSKLEEEGACSNDDVMPVLHAVQFELFNVKTAIGRREEAIVNLRKALEIKEKTLEEDSKELAKAYRDIAEAYVAILDFKEALPFCSKALEIHKMQLGNNSVEVAYDRRLLGVIYTGLENHEKALEQNQLSQKVLKNWGRSSDLLRAEIDASNMLIALGRYDEAINTLKSVVQQTEKESEDRATVFVSMAKALCNLENFADAKKCLEIACGIFYKKERNFPLVAAESYMEISMQYETMNEFETAISLLKRSLGILEKLPQEQHSVGSVSARIGWLFLLTGKVEKAIPYLEDAAERLKESFGSKHFGVGYVYNNLGAAYLELDRPQSAAQVFAYAKDIMDVSLGPHHVDSIEACQNLSRAYAAMGSYSLAINFQEKVIEAWEGHGQSAQDQFKEACLVLEQLKSKACDASSDESVMKAFPLPINSESHSKGSSTT